MTKRPAIPIWREHLLKLFVRVAVAYEDSDKAQQDEIGRKLRPVMARIGAGFKQASLDETARERIVADIEEAQATLTEIMGKDWQPTRSALAQALRNKGRLREVM